MKLTHDRSLYRNHGCRCQVCKDANTQYIRKYRENKKSTLQEVCNVEIKPESVWWRNTSGVFDPVKKREKPQKPYVAGHDWIVITDSDELKRLGKDYVTNWL